MVNKMVMVILAAMVTLTTVTLIASLVWGTDNVAGFSLAGLFDCKRAEAQVSHKDLAATISGMDSPGRLGVQDSGQAQAAGRYNYDHAAEKSFYAPKTPKTNGGAPP